MRYVKQNENINDIVCLYVIKIDFNIIGGRLEGLKHHSARTTKIRMRRHKLSLPR